VNLLNSPLLPDLLYLSLVAGLWLSALAVLSPGTGVYELLAVLALGLAGLGTTVVPPNSWAFIPLALGAAFYVISLRRRREAVWLALSALALSAGSIFLFRSASGGPAVNPWLALVTTVLTVAYFWVVVRQTLASQLAHPTIDPGKVLGQIGEVRTPITPAEMGSVYAGGELWTARASTAIPVGASVRVTDREGLILIVEVEEAQGSQRGGE
jgi:membrane-bound serine protease (ClpP class)